MATKNTAMQRTDERANYDLDRQTMSKVIDTVVLRGDLSGLGPSDRARFYVQMCEGLGLNPASQPFAFLRLNGKEVLYATRGATDQLAAMHRVTREIIDGPKVIDLAGSKMVYAVCKASLPNGRFETATATVPLVDPVNVLMKCETKAKRRATLSILGLGVLDELEIETIPAGAQEPGSHLDLSRAKDPRTDDATDAEFEEDTANPLAAFHAALPGLANVEDAAALWHAHRVALGAAGDGRTAAWNELVKRTMKFGGGVASASAAKNALKTRLAALAEADAKPAAPVVGERTPAPDDDTAQGRAANDPDNDHMPVPEASPANDPAPEASTSPAQSPELGTFLARVAEIELPGEAVSVWMKHRAALAPLPVVDRETAWRSLVKRTEEVGRLKNAAVWLKKAIAEEDARTEPPTEILPADVLESLLADLGTARDTATLAATWEAIAASDYHRASPAQRAKLDAARTAREKALRQPPPGGPKGTRTRAGAGSPDARGSSADPAAASEGATMSTAEQWRAHLAAKPWRGKYRGAGDVAGAWLKHRDELTEAGARAECLAITIDELAARGVSEPGAWIDGVREHVARAA